MIDGAEVPNIEEKENFLDKIIFDDSQISELRINQPAEFQEKLKRPIRIEKSEYA